MGGAANSQKMTFEWASTWKGTWKEFLKKVKDFGGQWLWEHDELAENDPRLGLNMERKIGRIQSENEGFRGSGAANSQKMTLEWASIWRGYGKEMHRENEGFRSQWLWGGAANSQKMTLEWASTWRGKWEELHGGVNGAVKWTISIG